MELIPWVIAGIIPLIVFIRLKPKMAIKKLIPKDLLKRSADGVLSVEEQQIFRQVRERIAQAVSNGVHITISEIYNDVKSFPPWLETCVESSKSKLILSASMKEVTTEKTLAKALRLNLEDGDFNFVFIESSQSDELRSGVLEVLWKNVSVFKLAMQKSVDEDPWRSESIESYIPGNWEIYLRSVHNEIKELKARPSDPSPESAKNISDLKKRFGLA